MHWVVVALQHSSSLVEFVGDFFYAPSLEQCVSVRAGGVGSLLMCSQQLEGAQLAPGDLTAACDIAQCLQALGAVRALPWGLQEDGSRWFLVGWCHHRHRACAVAQLCDLITPQCSHPMGQNHKVQLHLHVAAGLELPPLPIPVCKAC